MRRIEFALRSGLLVRPTIPIWEMAIEPRGGSRSTRRRPSRPSPLSRPGRRSRSIITAATAAPAPWFWAA
jgi:hypothetical protein